MFANTDFVAVLTEFTFALSFFVGCFVIFHLGFTAPMFLHIVQHVQVDAF